MREFQRNDAKGRLETWRVFIEPEDGGGIVHQVWIDAKGTRKEREWFLDPRNAMSYFIDQQCGDGWKEVRRRAAKPAGPAADPTPGPLPRLALPSVRVGTKAFPRIDRAIEKARKFVHAWPERQLIVEDVLRKTLIDRCEEVVDHAKAFVRIHETRSGRWHRARSQREIRRIVDSDDSPSYRYFCARYGTFTWVSSLQARNVGFLIGNVTGGGEGVIEILDSEHAPAIAELIPDDMLEGSLAGHGLAQAIVFHGGWGGAGWVFDTRRSSKSGEWPIVRFDIEAPIAALRSDARVAKDKSPILGFDVWLEHEVDRCIRALAPVAKRARNLARPADV